MHTTLFTELMRTFSPRTPPNTAAKTAASLAPCRGARYRRSHPARFRLLGLLLLVTASLPARAQIDLSRLDALAEKANETMEITLDSSTLRMAGGFLARSENEEEIGRLVDGLTSITVRSFEFDQDGAFTVADLDSIRSQLQAPLWNRIINIHEGDGLEDLVEIYVRGENNQTTGLTIIAAESDELTVVSIEGAVSLETLARLGGSFGIPSLNLMKFR